MKSTVPVPVIETVALSKLKPWDRNPRIKHAVDLISDSIGRFGYLSPIIVQKGTYRILGGHGRLKALKQRHVKEVPVIVADISDANADLYTIADNKLHDISIFDTKATAELLKGLGEMDLNITGFSSRELNLMNKMSDDKLAMDMPTVVTLPLKDIKPYWRNPRDSNATVEKLKHSIKAYGYNELIVVDPNYTIVAGHARYLALRELGVQKISVVVAHLDERKARAYRIVDNKLTEYSKWTPELNLEMRQLQGELKELQTYFTDDLDELVGMSVGLKRREVLAKDIEEAQAKLSGQIDPQKRFQEVVCPKCGHEFMTSPDTVKRVFVTDAAMPKKVNGREAKRA